MSERIDRLLDRMLASARAGDTLLHERELDSETTYRRTAEGIELVEATFWSGAGVTGTTTALTLDDGRARLRAELVRLDVEGAWHRTRSLGYLEARWVPPASGIWRTGRDELVVPDGDGFVLIDATGAILRRYMAHGDDYPVAYVPSYDMSGTFYDIDKQRALIEHAWTVNDIGVGGGSDRVVLSDLLADHDPETPRFVAIVLADAAVTAEEKG